MKNATTLPLRSVFALASAALLSLGLAACSEDTVDEASSTFSSVSSASSTQSSSSNTTRDRDRESNDSDDDGGPHPTLANDSSASEDSRSNSSATTATPTEEAVSASASSSGSCNAEQFRTEQMFNPVVSYCDGEYIHFGQAQSDWTVYAHWNGNRWVGIEPDGRTFTGFGCYSDNVRSQYDLPAEIDEAMLEC